MHFFFFCFLSIIIVNTWAINYLLKLSYATERTCRVFILGLMNMLLPSLGPHYFVSL